MESMKLVQNLLQQDTSAPGAGPVGSNMPLPSLPLDLASTAKTQEAVGLATAEVHSSAYVICHRNLYSTITMTHRLGSPWEPTCLIC